MYSVKEVFYTLQGEGQNSGRPAVFCRFAGCNLWSGVESNRTDAVCQFCDTDFVGTDGAQGGKYQAAGPLLDVIERTWGVRAEDRFVVFTGGEPLLQLDGPLIKECHARGFMVAVETNGTIVPPDGIDWITVSPKAGAPLLLRTGDELKLVYPQQGAEPSSYESLQFEHFYLQPMDGPTAGENTSRTVQYCLDHPKWRLSLQTHKLLGIR